MKYPLKYNINLLLYFCLVSASLLYFPESPLFAQQDYSIYPDLDWHTFETEHFKINYYPGTERTAYKVAQIAEEIYPHITGLYRYEPEEKTEFIIRDTHDYSNGGAYYYDNKIEIWAPNMDFLLRGTHNWLRDVVTHEFTHIISLRKSLKFGTHIPAGWFQVFGYEEHRRKDVVRGFPNVLISYPISGTTIPVWFAEGVAQFQSPSKRYDYRDSHREMILRDRVMTGNLLDLKQMSVFGKNSVGNESAYNQGFAFVQFLARTYGDTILTDIAEQAASPLRLDFNRAIYNTTGTPADSIYSVWQNYLSDTYSNRLSTIQKHLTTGEPLQEEGIGNVFPVYSPDGKKVAYLESRSDYLSVNALVVEDLESGHKKAVAGAVSSSISWSPNGRYIAYSKQTHFLPGGHKYNDIFVYDLRKYEEYQLTRSMRAANPDWSHDGQKLAFVVQSDGITNLFTLTLDELVWIDKQELWHTRYYDLQNHTLVENIPPDKRSHRERYYRKVQYWGRDIRQLTHLTNGRQIYHPRWAPGDSSIVFDTSVDFCRDIARISVRGGEMEFILNAAYDERYPSFSSENGELFYASDRTGIFNIYSYNFQTGKIKPHTNVIGGAFMPSVNQRGDLVYSLYKDQGYKIYRIRRVNELPPENLAYLEDYESNIPRIRHSKEAYTPPQSRPYHRRFGPVAVMPRLLIDYGTVKPGVYVYSNELLNKMSFFGGADVNLDREYNLFTLFEFRFFRQASVFFNFFNQTAKIEEQLTGTRFYTSNDKFDVNFNLMEAELGLNSRFRNYFDMQLKFIYRYYRAKIGTFAYKELSSGKIDVSPPFRYTYLRGYAGSLSLKREVVQPEIDSEINPRKGYYFFLKYTREQEKFLEDFATDRVLSLEKFNKYQYNQFELDAEKYLPVPFTDHHALSLRFQGGLIDRPVDDFFNFFAGGLVGLKGYPYYSIEGRKMALGTASYRFPLMRHLNLQILNWQLDKIYLGAFYQYGNAWNEGGPTWEKFKSDVGVQLRLETFSWYMFPTRIFFEAAYPLDEPLNKRIKYEQEWKFYFGILFDFDLRFDKQIRKVL